jgi:hypothetical protein
MFFLPLLEALEICRCELLVEVWGVRCPRHCALIGVQVERMRCTNECCFIQVKLELLRREVGNEFSGISR